MGLLEDTFVTLKSAANVAVEKTGKMIDVSKLKIGLSEQNSKLSRYFEDLGRMVYTYSKNENINDSAKDDVIAKIDKTYEKIKELSAQIALSKNQIVCEKCGFDNDREMVYCGKCGYLLRQEAEKDISSDSGEFNDDNLKDEIDSDF